MSPRSRPKLKWFSRGKHTVEVMYDNNGGASGSCDCGCGMDFEYSMSYKTIEREVHRFLGLTYHGDDPEPKAGPYTW